MNVLSTVALATFTINDIFTRLLVVAPMRAVLAKTTDIALPEWWWDESMKPAKQLAGERPLLYLTGLGIFSPSYYRACAENAQRVEDMMVFGRPVDIRERMSK